MKKNTVVLSLIFLSTVTRAQDGTPNVLRDAAHCLAVENFELGKPGSTAIRLGYVIDKESYPGETVMYVVSYTKEDRSKGLVYTIFLTEKDGKSSFNIQNNATFVSSKKDIHFRNPPLGGVWTQQHVMGAIEEIQKQATYTLGVTEAFSLSASTTCDSYVGNLHK
jgi:hypothetical protein